jgi:DNA polymerase III delta prime subunit
MSHLSDSANKITSLEDSERIKYINSDKWIGYPAALAILKKMEMLLGQPALVRMPHLLLTSQPGNGKTILLQRFFEAYKPIISVDVSTLRIPVLYVLAPDKPDEHTFYINILMALNAPFRESYKTVALRNQVYRILQKVETKVLIIDEIHNILLGAYSSQQYFLSVLKGMANSLRITIIAAGINEAELAFNSDNQLAMRFRTVRLPKWKMGPDFLRLLASFETLLPLKNPSRLSTDEIAMEIISMSGGIIGEISYILKLSAIHAIMTKSERIDHPTLKKIDYEPPLGKVSSL